MTGEHPIRDLSLSSEFCPLSLLALRGIRGLCRRQSVQISAVVVTLRNLINKGLFFFVDTSAVACVILLPLFDGRNAVSEVLREAHLFVFFVTENLSKNVSHKSNMDSFSFY